MPWTDHGVTADDHRLMVCNATTGHIYRSVAFADTAERAKDIALALNDHEVLIDALRKIVAVLGYDLKHMVEMGWEYNQAVKDAYDRAINALGNKPRN